MLMSKSAYAKHRGVSRQTVYDWIAKGDLVMSVSKIDVDATDNQRTPAGRKDYDRANELEMSWGDFWRAIKSADDTTSKLHTDDEVKQRILDAAESFYYDVEFTDGTERRFSQGQIW